jgi:hypothetical protein
LCRRARTFEKACTKQAQDKAATQEKGGLATRELLDIVDQSPKVIVLEIVCDTLDLRCRTFNIAGCSLLILLAQLLTGPT